MNIENEIKIFHMLAILNRQRPFDSIYSLHIDDDHPTFRYVEITSAFGKCRLSTSLDSDNMVKELESFLVSIGVDAHDLPESRDFKIDVFHDVKAGVVELYFANGSHFIIAVDSAEIKFGWKPRYGGRDVSLTKLLDSAERACLFCIPCDWQSV